MFVFRLMSPGTKDRCVKAEIWSSELIYPLRCQRYIAIGYQKWALILRTGLEDLLTNSSGYTEFFHISIEIIVYPNHSMLPNDDYKCWQPRGSPWTSLKMTLTVFKVVLLLKNLLWKTYESKDDLQSTKYRTHADFCFSSSVAEPHSGKLRRPAQATKSSDYFGRARCP